MSKQAVILMTALLPTIGHKALIDFALNLVGERGDVDVIISTRTFEPILPMERFAAFCTAYMNEDRVHIIHHRDDNAPQNPSNEEEWNYWKKVVLDFTYGEYEYDYFVASEPYGKKMADLIGAQFIPFDIDRQLVSVKSSDVRNDLQWRFSDILPEFKKYLLQKITLFGQESTGKTTFTKILTNDYMSTSIHEFARPYLEMMDDKTVTDAKMHTITEGQYALQKTAYDSAFYGIVFQDTDLLSTIGYSRIYGGELHPKIVEYFQETKSNLYIVMNDEIPFVEDELRYGGKVRESTKQFWIDLLEEFDCNYYVVQSNYFDSIENELYNVVDDHMKKVYDPIRKFTRD